MITFQVRRFPRRIDTLLLSLIRLALLLTPLELWGAEEVPIGRVPSGGVLIRFQKDGKQDLEWRAQLHKKFGDRLVYSSKKLQAGYVVPFDLSRSKNLALANHFGFFRQNGFDAS